MTEPDLWFLHRQMARSRFFEEAAARLWDEGRISGEMHLAVGEEAVAAGVVSHLLDGDAMALDHRGTPQLLMRGVDPVPLLLELLGHAEGLCAGKGGHMHLFSRDHLAASSGIVGASAPAAVGFALAARSLRPGRISAAFFGEGAMNQGVVMESLNLASIWKLPVLFVCKDNGWSITTPSPSVTSGNLVERAGSFGMPATAVDGSDASAVWKAARSAVDSARAGGGPSFLLAKCFRPEGHFLGDPLLRIARRPVGEAKRIAGPMLKSMVKKNGARVSGRAGSLGTVVSTVGRSLGGRSGGGRDPLETARAELKKDPQRLREVEGDARREINGAVDEALRIAGMTGKGSGSR
jgi:acetoin:2,6-dichlorophenolindophenol oxidoreductase subunit alpha